MAHHADNDWRVLRSSSKCRASSLSVLRDRNQLYRTNTDGFIENTYTLKIINKTQQPQQYQLSVEGLSDVKWYGRQTVQVSPGEVFSLPITLGADPSELDSAVTRIEFKLDDQQGFTINTESRFIKQL